MNKYFRIVSLLLIILSIFSSVDAKRKQYQGGMGGMNGGPFGNKKMQMVFITVRDGYLDPKGIDKMAKDFQSIMSTGGIQVGIVGVDNN